MTRRINMRSVQNAEAYRHSGAWAGGTIADDARRLVEAGRDRDIFLGSGRPTINTDGGCLACGEPIGASGLRQVYENVVQLRGAGGARQVARKPRTAYSHVYGAPGVSAVVILQG